MQTAIRDRQASLTIRQMRSGDLPVVAHLQMELARHHGQALDPNALLRGLRRILNDERVGNMLVACQPNGNVVGCLSIKPLFEEWNGCFHGFLDNFCVDEHWRGRGIGRKMLDHAITFASTRYDCLRLYITHDNVSVRDFYQEFETFGTAYHLDLDKSRNAVCVTGLEQSE